ncbi:thy-1 membrane glycoprotein isoform X1 [Ovis aries]|uniref:thy-1 membrane glycoprotein isoform X1 n=1 Tax=Ovis aries TaxID=9940 RepID=UPI00295288E0|nr:thy-1 membrane glycoprotein isoform X1 [Ovis aries]XP_060255777.1 thy-1 membrane glycoprotein isoform X1 [Ovis aries]
MNPTIGIALLLTVLQVARGQKVTSLTACLVNQSLRLDCHHENTTTTPMQYEFSLTRDTKKWVLSGSNGVTRPEYSSRTKFFSKYNLKVLYLSNFTTKDEGTYTCELRLSGPNPTVSNKDVSVFRGEASPLQDQVSGQRQAGEERASWDTRQASWLGHRGEWPRNLSPLVPYCPLCPEESLPPA